MQCSRKGSRKGSHRHRQGSAGLTCRAVSTEVVWVWKAVKSRRCAATSAGGSCKVVTCGRVRVRSIQEGGAKGSLLKSDLGNGNALADDGVPSRRCGRCNATCTCTVA